MMLKRLLLLFCLVSTIVHASNNCGCCIPCGKNSTTCLISEPCRSSCNDGCISNKGCEFDCDISHTFFKARQTTTNNMLQDNLSLYWWYHDVLCEDDCAWWTMQVTPFYQRSTNGKQVAQYFLPCKQSCIEVKEDGTGDVGSLWLNLIAADDAQFNSVVSIRPQRSAVGVYFNFRFDLSQVMCHSWMDLSFAAMRVKHDLHFCEDNKVPGVKCDLESVCESLNQPDWQFGRFNTCSMTRKGVDDIQLRFGYDWFYCDTDHLSPYFVATISTGNRTCPQYIFEPTVGSKHGSIGLGLIGDLRIWECENQELTVINDFKYRYVLRACEIRSFDLCKNGDWSRYLQVVQSDARSNALPGINAFTQEVRATPRSVIDWWVALHYQWCQINVELGYDLWWRQKERIELCCFPQNIGIYDMVGDCNQNPVSASCAMICQSVSGDNTAPSDTEFVTLTCDDINLDSGATPRAISNTIYAALGYDGMVCTYPSLIGIGASYEFGHDCTALDNWMLWIKMGMAF